MNAGVPRHDSDGAVVSAADAGRPLSTVFSNAMFMAGGEVVSRAIGFVAILFISRRLGPAGFGLIGFAAAFASYFGVVVNGGLANIGAQAVARDPDCAPELVLGVALLRACIAICLFAALWGAVALAKLPANERLLVRLSGLVLFTFALDVAWAYKGLERGGRVAAGLVTGQLCMLAAILTLVRAAADVRWVPIAQFVGEVVAVVVLFVPLAIRARRANLAAAAKLLQSASLPGVTRLLRAVIFSFDVLLIGFLGQRHDLGLYTAAYRVCLLVIAVQAALHSSYWAAGARATSATSLGAVVTRAIGLAGAVSLPMVAGGIVLGSQIMTLLFGGAYAAGGPMLGWLMLSIGFAVVQGAYRVGLIAAGAASRELIIMVAAAIVNVAANLVVVPRYGGFGAAIVTAGSEAVSVTLCMISGHKRGWGVQFDVLGPSVVAAAAMSGVLLLIRNHLPALPAVMLGATVYVSALLLVGVPEDAQPLLRSIKQRIALVRAGA